MTVSKQALAAGLGVTLGLALGLGILVWWLSLGPRLAPQLPGEDRPGYSQETAMDRSGAPLPIGRDFRPGASLSPAAAALEGAWPGFRGPALTGVAPAGPALSDLSDWQDKRIVWQTVLGEGHAGPAVAEGRVYLLDYDEKAKAEALRCLSLASGSELWRRSWPLRMKRNHGYSRTVPAIAGKFVVSIGPMGQVMCLDRLSGDLVWSLDPSSKWQAEVPLWYAGQCPLVVGDTLVLAVGGEVLMAGIDLASGEVRWTAPNTTGAKATHASVTPMTVGSTACYLACFSTGLFGISPEGRILFRVAEWSVQVEVPSPQVLPGNLVYLTAGYGGGNMTVRLASGADGMLMPTVLARNQPGTGLSCEQQTPLVLDGRLYGIQTKDSGALHDQLACMAPDGRTIWTSGKARRFGLGPYLAADNKLYVLADDGWLTVVAAGGTEYRELSRNRIFEATDAWAPMALAGKFLLIRDDKNLLCLDIGARP